MKQDIVSANSKNGYPTADEEVTDALSGYYRKILGELGEDLTRQGIQETPVRVARAMQFMTQGYDVDPDEILKGALFEEDYSQMVLVKDIELYSLCEHHILPFFGKAHIAYVPSGKIVGLSKIPRLVDAFARRLQVQERLTTQIRDSLVKALEPAGAAVVIEAQHMCMQMRGVQKQNSVTTTSAFHGEFLEEETRNEFIHLISSNLH